MTDNSENPLSLTLAAWMLALIGWLGLLGLIFNVDPRLGVLPVWIFFVLWLMALTGTAVPFVAYLNRRFAPALAPPSVLLRQSIWVGLFGATCAWLQKGGLLNPAIAALLAAGLGGVEWFLRWREASRWTPEPAREPDEPA
ncbi:MAG TPA: hypothetical protein VI793_05695 [Anaerolineales bacterium]|nr:hypothetical protein [Anaerolineales bacterium]